MVTAETLAESRRSMEICNACRYCEGYCAVFPAMELRREFARGDLVQLANLCHDCRGCFYACQYAPPHEFALNLPKAFAELRAQTYAEYAWPRAFASLFARNGTVVSLITAGCIALLLIIAAWLRSPLIAPPPVGPGAFYRVIPEWAMLAAAGGTFVFSVLAIAIGARRFWCDSGPAAPVVWADVRAAGRDLATLRNLGGGGHGCNDLDEEFSNARRWLHHAMFYGFVLCFASTVTAAFYEHVLGRVSPYSLLSLPVILGTVGGLALTIGTGGFLWLRLIGDSEPASDALRGGGYALIVQLLLTAVTGLLLLMFRATSAMAILLAIHLGAVLSFFVTMPYGKFVHGIYRSAALLRGAQQSRLEADRS
jgi:citrate/tricarballylate utilization protein